MPVYEVSIPKAGKFRIESQSDLDDAAVFRIASGQADMQRMADPTSGQSFMQNYNAAQGGVVQNVIDAGKQMFGGGPGPEEVRERRRLDAPLLNTAGGKAGNVAGNILGFAPLAAVPGANTVAGAGAIGAMAGALQPTETTGERLTNMGIGGGLGAGTQALAGPVAQKVGEWGGKREAAANALKSQNSVRDETLRMGQEAGYVVPGSAVNPTATNRILESIGGKAAVGHEAVKRNQPITDALGRKAGGLSPEQPLSRDNLRTARQGMAGPYRELAGISPQASDDLSALQKARFDSKMAWKEYNRQGNRTAFDDATKAGAEIKRLQDALEGHATTAGRPELVDALKQARKSIAQNRQVQEAVNVGSGHMDPAVIGRALDNDAPLSGDLLTVGRMHQTFRDFMKDSSGKQAPGTNNLLAWMSALGASGGGFAGGPVGAAAGAAAPFVIPPAARAAALSKTGQSVLAKPNYSVGPMAKGASALNDPETRRRAALLARSLALPAIPQAVNE